MILGSDTLAVFSREPLIISKNNRHKSLSKLVEHQVHVVIPYIRTGSFKTPQFDAICVSNEISFDLQTKRRAEARLSLAALFR